LNLIGEVNQSGLNDPFAWPKQVDIERSVEASRRETGVSITPPSLVAYSAADRPTAEITDDRASGSSIGQNEVFRRKAAHIQTPR
jgi:hypothetical protein